MRVLEDTLNHELLCYAVGRALFCPDCNRVLDASGAVLVTARDSGPDAPAPGIACADCWDAYRANLRAVDETALLARCDILDGRELTQAVR